MCCGTDNLFLEGFLMRKTLLILGVCFFLAAGVTYYVINQDTENRMASASRFDASMSGLSRTLYQMGASTEVNNSDLASKVQGDQTLTWFFAGAGTLCVIVSLAVSEKSNTGKQT